MALISWIVVGAIAGWVANLLTGARSKGCAADIVIGMTGSIIGGLLFNLLQNGNLNITTAFTSFTLVSLIVSVLGAIILVGIVEFLRK